MSDELLGGIFRGSFNLAIDFEVYDDKNLESGSLLYDRDGIMRAKGQGEENTTPSPLLFDGDRTKRTGERVDDTLFSKESRIEVAGRE